MEDSGAGRFGLRASRSPSPSGLDGEWERYRSFLRGQAAGRGNSPPLFLPSPAQIHPRSDLDSTELSPSSPRSTTTETSFPPPTPALPLSGTRASPAHPHPSQLVPCEHCGQPYPPAHTPDPLRFAPCRRCRRRHQTHQQAPGDGSGPGRRSDSGDDRSNGLSPGLTAWPLLGMPPRLSARQNRAI